MRWVVVLAAALVAAPVVARAGDDASGPAFGRSASQDGAVAARWTTWSPDGHFVAELDPARMETAVYRLDADGGRHYEWSMPGWFSHAALANGGNSFVVGADEGGTVEANWNPGDVVLRFYDRGLLVHALTLSELVPDPREMIRVQSHYYWGRTRGFDASGRYVVETVDHVWRFVPATGQRELD